MTTSNSAPVAAVELPVRNYGEQKLGQLKSFIVTFSGRESLDLSGYQQPVRVTALDVSEAWSQVVEHYNLDATRLKPIVTCVD